MKSWFGRFFSQSEEVERVLRRRPKMPQPQPGLHESIMQAVRSARAKETRRRPASGVWWMLATATAAVVVAAALWLPRSAAPGAAPKPLALSTEIAGAPGAAFDLGAKMPAMLMAPLSNEMARVDQDVHNTTQVLLGSFP